MNRFQNAVGNLSTRIRRLKRSGMYSLPEEGDPTLDPDTQRSLSLDAKFHSLSVSEEEFDDARIRRREKRAADKGLKRQARQESMGGLADDDFSPTSSPFGSTDSVEGVRFVSTPALTAAAVYEEVTRPVRRRSSATGGGKAFIFCLLYAYFNNGSLRRWSSEKSRRRSSTVSDVPEENSANGRRMTRRRSMAARATIDLGVRTGRFVVALVLAKEDVSEVMFSMGYHPNAGQLTVTIIKARNLARVGSENPPVRHSLVGRSTCTPPDHRGVITYPASFPFIAFGSVSGQEEIRPSPFVCTPQRCSTHVRVRAGNVEEPPSAPDDTYVRVALMCESRKIGKKKTSVQNGAPNPTFNESFHFDVAEDDMKGVFLSLVVEDSGGPTLGKCEVGPWTDQWNEMMEKPRKPVTRWCQLKEVTSDRRRSSEDQE
ncbi:Cytosolic phospholipase A2 zeta [Branchiostoma belcheri]|nr:Cytosolic phospholipase A2 zeta [Branchiostoma belcheri]